LKYDKYRKSELSLLEEIPEHWKTVRLKDLIKVISKGTTPSTEGFSFTTSGIRFIKAENINNSRSISAVPEFYISEEAHKALKRSQLRVDDLLIVITGATIGNISVLSDKFFPANTNQNVCFIRLKDREYKDYLFFTFNGFFIQQYIWYSANQSAQPSLGMNVLSNFKLFIPPRKHEIVSIVNFLDKKIELIDRKVSILETKILYYNELVKSLINEVVCKGLNRDVSFKESGVEWLGKVARHWEIKRIDELFTERSEKVSDTIFPPLSVSMNGIVPQMEGTAKTKNNDDRKKVVKGDFVINSRSDRRGASGLSNYKGSVSVINIVLKPKKNTSVRFYHYFFRSYRFTEEFYKYGKGIVDDLWSTKFSAMKTFMVCVPPVEEQTAIAEYLDSKTGIIDVIVANIKQQVDNLKELRKTLINDVVTGKIKVTENEVIE
jgi:type I restriction enzyme S subunit